LVYPRSFWGKYKEPRRGGRRESASGQERALELRGARTEASQGKQHKASRITGEACAGNITRGGSIFNADWRGVRFPELLGATSHFSSVSSLEKPKQYLAIKGCVVLFRSQYIINKKVTSSLASGIHKKLEQGSKNGRIEEKQRY
jgi:hypothetical protein